MALRIILICEYVQIGAACYGIYSKKDTERDRKYFIFCAIIATLFNGISLFDGRLQMPMVVIAIVAIILFWGIVVYQQRILHRKL